MSLGITQAHCNRCGHSTSHDILASERSESTHEQEDGFVPYDLYEMLRCRGCETVTLRLTSRGSRDESPWVVYYPPAIARRMPAWVRVSLEDLDLLLPDDPPPIAIPFRIRALMREIYAAVQNGSRRLAAMGIRAALESVMIDKVSDKGTFTKNMDAFDAAGYLSVRQRGHLDTILDAGHATIHRGWEPTDANVIALLDIAESIIEVAYLHDKPVDDLDRNIPPKPRRSARKP